MSETSVKIMECAVADSGVIKIDRIGVGVGVILYSATQKKAAGVHVLSPHTTEAEPANPAKYANTAIPHAVAELGKKGAGPPFIIAVAGGAEMMNVPPQVRMGKRIVTALGEALKKAKLTIEHEKTGGPNTRSLMLDLGTGQFNIT